MGNEQALVPSTETDLEFDEVNFSCENVHHSTLEHSNHDKTLSVEEKVNKQKCRDKKSKGQVGERKRKPTSLLKVAEKAISSSTSSPSTALKLHHETIRPTHLQTNIVADPAQSNVMQRKRTKPVRCFQQIKHATQSFPSEVKKSSLESSTSDSTRVSWNKARKREKFPAPPGFTELSDVDLSHLDPQEMAAILEVAARAQQIDQLENRKVRKMQEQVESFSSMKQHEQQDIQKKNESSINKRDVTTPKKLSHHQTDSPSGSVIQQPVASENFSKHSNASANQKERAKPRDATSPKRSVDKRDDTVSQKEMSCSICENAITASASMNQNIPGKLAKKIKEDKSDLDHLVCSSCSKIICTSCASSSVLAKKGKFLCKLCLKRRELAAHEWLLTGPPKVILNRSASAEMSIEEKKAETSAVGKKLSSRSRSYSASSSSSVLPNEGNNKQKDDHKSKEHSGSRFDKISTSEALVRRLSQDELVQNELRKSMRKKDSSKSRQSSLLKENKNAEKAENDKMERDLCANERKVVGLNNKTQTNPTSMIKNSIGHEKLHSQNDMKQKVSSSKQPPPYLNELQRKLSTKSSSVLEVTSSKLPQCSGKETLSKLAESKSLKQEEMTDKKSISELAELTRKEGFTKNGPNATAIANPRNPISSIDESKSSIKSLRNENIKVTSSQIGRSKEENGEGMDKTMQKNLANFSSSHSFSKATRSSISTASNPVNQLPFMQSENENKGTNPDAKQKQKNSLQQVKDSSLSEEVLLENKMEAEPSIDPLTLSRRSSIEEKSGFQGALSVSSYTESEGPAEWSVDELDDGDTFFLVTSSGENGKSLPSGFTTPSTLRSESGEGFTQPSLLMSGSDVNGSSFEFIDEENDTEGDFDVLVRDDESSGLLCYSGLKRGTHFPDLSLVSSQHKVSESVLENVLDSFNSTSYFSQSHKVHNVCLYSKEVPVLSDSGRSNTVKGDDSVSQNKEKDVCKTVNAPHVHIENNISTTKSPQPYNKGMQPGETFFKVTSCDVDLSAEEKEQPKPVLRKSFPVRNFSDGKDMTSCSTNNVGKITSATATSYIKPIPAKRSLSVSRQVPIITISSANDSEQTDSSSSRASQECVTKKSSTYSPTESDSTVASLVDKYSSKEDPVKPKEKKDSLGRTVGKSPYVNTFGSRVIQTPSGAKLPISPLAKKVHSCENVSIRSNSKPIEISNKIWAIQSSTYFDSDSGSDSSEVEEEIEILTSATTSTPVHSEYMKKLESSSTADRKTEKSPSSVLRRTTSTDNFEELLKKTTKTPRPRRSKHSVSSSNIKQITSLKAENPDSVPFETNWGRSVSLSPPIKNTGSKCETISSAGRRNSEPAISDELRKNEGYADLCNKVNVADNGDKLNNSGQSSSGKRVIDLANRKDSMSVLSHKSTDSSAVGTSVSFCGSDDVSKLNTMARCISCGFLANNDDKQVITKTLSPSTDRQAPTSLQFNKSVQSVNSSTQVTPESETAPSSLASFDICQLTALIQAFKNSTDTLPSHTSTGAGCNVKLAQTENPCHHHLHSPNKTSQPSIAITQEPTSITRPVQKLFTCDASTETCLCGEPIVLPSDKLLPCRRYVKCGRVYDEPYTKHGMVDSGVGTSEFNRNMHYRSLEPQREFPVRYSTQERIFDEGLNYPHQDFRSVRSIDRSFSYDNEPSYSSHLSGRRFPSMTNREYENYEERQLNPYGWQSTKWIHGRPHQNSEPYYLHPGEERKEVFTPYSVAHNIEFEEEVNSPYAHPAKFSNNPYSPKSYFTRYRSQPKLNRIVRPRDYLEQIPPNLRSIYENEFSKMYRAEKEEPPIGTNVVSRGREKLRRQHYENNEKQDTLQLFPNGNFNLRRSASVPSVSRTETEKTDRRRFHPNFNSPTNAADNYVTYSSREKQPRVRINNFHDADVNDVYSNLPYNQIPLQCESTIEQRKDGRPDFQSGFSTASTTGTSLSSAAYHLSPPSSPGHRQNLGYSPSSLGTENKLPSSKTNIGIDEPLQSLNLPHEEEDGIIQAMSIRKTGRLHARLPQPPDQDEHRARYYANKRYNIYPPVRTRPTVKGRSEESAKHEVNKLRQTMEDLDQEEKELDMKLRYLELGRMSKTSSMASLSGGSAFQPNGTALLLRNEDKLYNADPARGVNKMERQFAANSYEDKSEDVEGAHSFCANNHLPGASSTLQKQRPDKEQQHLRQQRNYVIVSDVDQIVKEEDDINLSRGFRIRDDTEVMESLDYVTRKSSHSPHNISRRRSPQPRESSRDKYESQNWNERLSDTAHLTQNRCRERNYESRSQSAYNDYTRDVRRKRPNVYSNEDTSHHDSNRFSRKIADHNFSSASNRDYAAERNFEQRQRYRSDASNIGYDGSRSYYANYILQNPDDLLSPWLRMQSDSVGQDNYFSIDEPLLGYEETMEHKSKLRDNEAQLMERNLERKSMFHADKDEFGVRNIYEQIQKSREDQQPYQDNSSPHSCRKYDEQEIGQHTVKKYFDRKMVNKSPRDQGGENVDRPSMKYEKARKEGTRSVVSDTEEYNLRKEVNDWFDKPSRDGDGGRNISQYANLYDD